MIYLKKISSSLDNYINTSEMDDLVSFIEQKRDGYFLDLLHQTLLSCREHSQYVKKFVSQREKLINRRRGNEQTTKHFVGLLESVLNLSNQKLCFPRSEGTYTADKAYRYVRGAILEALVIKLVGEGRYAQEYDIWLDDCEIHNESGTPIFHIYKNCNEASSRLFNTKRNIDIAAWSVGRRGEFFECKLSPHGFKPENIEYLEKIKDHIDEHDEMISNASSIGGISLDTTERLLTNQYSATKDWFVPIGRDLLFTLSEKQIL